MKGGEERSCKKVGERGRKESGEAKVGREKKEERKASKERKKGGREGR
jgi:hypothetical protein